MDGDARESAVAMWLRLRWLSVLLNVAAILSAAGAYVLAAVAGTSTGDERVRLLVFGALLAGATVGLGALQQLRTARRVRTAEQVAIEAREDLTLTLNGALAPITNYLGEMAVAPTPEARAMIAGQLRQAVVDAAVRLTAAESRSAFYSVNREGTMLTREVYAGRSTLPRPTFVAGTQDGDAVLDLVHRGDLVFVVDVDPDPMVTPSTPDAYRTVIAVAVTAGLLRVGMLTVDAPVLGALTNSDVELVRVLANLLGSGLAQAA
jgi:hypothetical protein